MADAIEVGFQVEIDERPNGKRYVALHFSTGISFFAISLPPEVLSEWLDVVDQKVNQALQENQEQVVKPPKLVLPHGINLEKQ